MRSFICPASNHYQSGIVRVHATLLVLLVLLSLYPAAVLASTGKDGEYQSHESIKNRINGFIINKLTKGGKTDINIQIDRLDSRLKLTRCETELTPFLPSGSNLSGHISLGVRCSKPRPWSVYIPVRIDIFEQVLAASRPLLKGQVIGKSDIQSVRHKISNRGKTLFHDPSEITGMVVKRFIGTGKLITARLVEAPLLVRRGEEVILLAGTKSLSVRMVGKALADGSRGDLVQVRNTASQRIVEGIVTSPGVVKVKM